MLIVENTRHDYRSSKFTACSVSEYFIFTIAMSVFFALIKTLELKIFIRH